MPLPVIADTYRCTFNWVGTESDRPVVSVQHFRTAQIAADLVADLDGNIQTDQFAYTESLVEASSVDVIKLDGSAASQTFPLENWHSEGGGAEQIPGFNVMVLGSTGLRGAANRGRLFLPSPTENVITEGLLPTGNATAMTTAWQDFLEALDAVSVEYGVASYANETFTPYTTMTVPRKLGVIRRRRNTV